LRIVIFVFSSCDDRAAKCASAARVASAIVVDVSVLRVMKLGSCIPSMESLGRTASAVGKKN